MSKNLTRKGLALGAIVALGASLFSAAPAFAADELTLVPSTGDLYKVVAGETFKLTTGLAPATNAGNIVQLKYQVVTDPANGVVTPVVKSGSTTYSNTASTTVANTAAYDATTNPVSIASVPAGSTNTIVYAPVASVGSANSVELTSTVTGTTAGSTNTAKVTAFFDANANGKLDSGEYASAERTVTWIRSADIAATVTISKVSVGDTKITATATLTGLNTTQITIANYGFLFRNNDATKTAITGITAPAVVATVKTDGSITSNTGTLSTAVAAGKSYRADVVYKVSAGWATTADTDVVGTGNTIDAVARTIATIDAKATAATGVTTSAAVQATTSANGSATVAAKTNASYSIVGTVKDSATTPAVVAGAEGTAVLSVGTGAALSSTRKVTVNGTTVAAALTSSNNSFAVTSGADGTFTLAVSSTGLVATDALVFTVTIQNIVNVVTVTYADSTFTIIDNADVAGAVGRTIVKGAAYKFEYKVLDQFGDAPSAASTAFRLVDTVTGTTATANAGTYYSAIAADGSASFSFTDNSTVAGSGAHVITIQKSTDSFANATAVTGTITDTVTIKATAAEVTAKTVAIGTPTKGAGAGHDGQASITSITAGTAGAAATFAGTGTLSSATFAAYDGRTSKEAAPALGKGYSTAPIHTLGAWTAGVTTGLVSGDAKITIPVTVKDSTLAATAIDGASVTVAAKGFLFVATGTGGKVTYGVDSLTFLADANGTSVDVYSHVTGEQSIVFTSGAATVTQKITFANYGTEVAAVALTSLAAQAQAGSTVTLGAVATDKWGNVVPNVQIAFSNTGSGYVQDTAAQLSDSKGAVTGRVIVLQNDLGTSYITATAAKAKTLLSADLASAKSVEFGLVDADVVAGGHRVFVNSEFAKGRTITVTIDGKRVYSKVQATDNAVELAFTQKKKGAHTVTVRISGGVVFSERVTTN